MRQALLMNSFYLMKSRPKQAGLALLGCSKYPKIIPADVHVEEIVVQWGITDAKDRDEIGLLPHHHLRSSSFS